MKRLPPKVIHKTVENEFIDFFASGHPLVEGLLRHYEESPIGRAVRCRDTNRDEVNAGLIAIYKEGPAFEVIAIDLDGKSRADWAPAVFTRPIAVRPFGERRRKETEWRDMVRRLGAMLDPTRRLHAIAAMRVRPRDLTATPS